MPPESEPTAPGLVLRRWRDADAGALVDIYRDPAMRRWTRIPITSHDDAVAWVAAQRDGWRTGDRLSFAVLDDDELAGCVVLKRGREVGYWTAAWARGRGVASRATDALSTWAFRTLDVAELELRHQIDNAASCRVALRAGYRLVATEPRTPPYPLAGHLHVRAASVVVPRDQSA